MARDGQTILDPVKDFARLAQQVNVEEMIAQLRCQGERPEIVRDSDGLIVSFSVFMGYRVGPRTDLPAA